MAYLQYDVLLHPSQILCLSAPIHQRAAGPDKTSNSESLLQRKSWSSFLLVRKIQSVVLITAYLSNLPPETGAKIDIISIPGAPHTLMQGSGAL